MLESKFQATLIKDLEKMFKGSIVLKNDPNYIQGIPDIVIFYKDKYAFLECKRYKGSPKQCNQSYYINYIDLMSFARFIYPGNREEVLDELQQAFGLRGQTRIFKC